MRLCAGQAEQICADHTEQICADQAVQECADQTACICADILCENALTRLCEHALARRQTCVHIIMIIINNKNDNNGINTLHLKRSQVLHSVVFIVVKFA